MAMQAISVGALNEQIKSLLESTFEFISVEGELSRITKHGSGHVYFTLKDEESTIRCVMFRANAARLKFSLEEGAHVIIHGALSLYKPRGEYQINCFSAEPYGQGALALAFEQLKKKLELKGYFDPSRKKSFPKFPKRLILVTSATGAALQDMQRVASQRWPLVTLIVLDVLVQGNSASQMIASAIERADHMECDGIVIGRGGGSIEDLWPFNEECVADAIYNASHPIVSAVGHEIDWVISDFIADLRAPTPSAAMQMLLPDQNELRLALDDIASSASMTMRQHFYRKKEQLNALYESFRRNGVEHRLQEQRKQIAELKERLNRQIALVLSGCQRDVAPLREQLGNTIKSTLSAKYTHLHQLRETIESNNPVKKSKKGFAQLSREGQVVPLETLQKGERFEAMDEHTLIHAEVISKETF